MDGDDDVVLARFKFLIFVFLFLFLLCCRFGGSDPLALASHVDFLGFFGLREECFYAFNVQEGPGKVVAFSDVLDSHTFCGESHGSMYILDCRIYAREFVHVVYCLFWHRAVLNASMLVVCGISYNDLRECWPSGMSSSRVSVFKILACEVKVVSHSVDCGHRHPFNTSSTDTIILVVLP